MIITRAMLPHLTERHKADIHQTPNIKAGDYFFMCSDGMLEQPDMEDGTSLRNIFSLAGGSPKDKVKILKTITHENKDNHSAFIIYIEDVIPAEKKGKKSGFFKFLTKYI